MKASQTMILSCPNGSMKSHLFGKRARLVKQSYNVYYKFLVRFSQRSEVFHRQPSRHHDVKPLRALFADL